MGYISLLKSQEINQCKQATKITIDLTGNIIPNTNLSYFLQNQAQQYVLYYPNNSSNNSFWYEVRIYEKTDLSLIIQPQKKGNIYNFFVYQDPKEGNFCTQVMDKKILPIRTNLLKDTSNTKGSGLSIDSDDHKTNTDYLYHTAFHAPIQANAGDVYYINVYHTEGNDCGHSLELGTNQTVQTFLTVHQDCFQDSLTKIPSFIPIIDPQLANLVAPKEKKFTNKLILKGMVKDSISGKPLKAGIQEYVKKIAVSDTTSAADGSFLTFLEGKIMYEIEFSAVGYTPKRLKFLKQTLQNELRDLGEIVLSPLQVGDRFILKDIYFHSGTYAIKEESNEMLEKLRLYLENNPEAEIEIQGHTNGKGKVKAPVEKPDLGPEWNFSGNEKKLSKLRAQAVKNYLVEKGIAENRIKASGYGAEKMLYPRPKNKQERDLNKRVEVIRIK